MSAHELSAADETGSTDPSRRLSLAGTASDGTLLLTDGDGGTFTLTVDARLRSAVADPDQTSMQTHQTPAGRREPSMETTTESVLRPRDIQARIRAGESPEQVASAAHTSVEKVMPFAGPVLAEREHIAGRAQKSSVRRPAGSSVSENGARTLGDVVDARLRSLNLDPTGLVEWDSWRREDGRWSLTGSYQVSASTIGRDGTARFTFDPPGNFVTLDNDDARWLVGDLPDEPPAAVVPAAGVRRLAAVHDRSAERSGERFRQPGPQVDDDQLSIDDELGIDTTGLLTDSPLEAFLDDRPGADESDLIDQAADAAALDTDHADVEPPRRRSVRKTRGRASVPSWDEIMFGPGD